MSNTRKRQGVIRAALCAGALLSAVAASPALLSRTAAAQGAPGGVSAPAWLDIPTPPKAPGASAWAGASSASAALDCHGSTPPASYPKGPRPYPCGQALVTGSFYAPVEGHARCYTSSCSFRPTVTGGDDQPYYPGVTSLDDSASLYDPAARHWTPTANLIDTCKAPPGMTDPSTTLPWKDGNNKGTDPPGIPIPCHAYRTATLLDPPGCYGGSPAVAPRYPCGKVLIQGPYDPFSTVGNNTVPSKPYIDAYGGNPVYPDRPSGDSQLYDPTTDTWAPIPVPTGEHGHMGWASQAVLLADGSVLVVPGGQRGSTITDTAEPPPPGLVLDFSATNEAHPLGTWFQTAPMAGIMGYPVPVLLPDGIRVLVLGTGVPDSMIYDSVAVSTNGRGVWSPAAPTPNRMLGETATTLSDGRVIVMGGDVRGRVPKTMPGGLRTPDPPMPDEQCVGIGGSDGYCGSRSVLFFDPITNSWTQGTPLLHRRLYHSASALPDGKILVAGGYGGKFDDSGKQNGVEALGSVEIYDPAGPGKPTDGVPMQHGRAKHSATILPLPGCDINKERRVAAPDYMCSRLVTTGGEIVGWITDPVDGLGAPRVGDELPEPTAEMLVPPPLITGLTPNRGPAGRSTPVKVSGFALAGSNLSIDGAPAPPCAASGCPPAPADPDTSALMMAPPRNTNAEVSVPVKAATTLPGGQVLESNSLPFTYFISPVVSGIDPVCGPEAGGTTVNLTGLQLTGSDQVFFGDKVVKPNILSDTKLSVQTPPHTGPGVVQLSVGKAGDRSDTTAAFTYPCPSIPPVRPPDAPVADAGVGGSNSSTTKSITGGFPVGPGGGHAGGVPSSAGAPSSAVAPGSSLAPGAAGGPGLGTAPSQAAGFGAHTALSPGAALSPGLSPPVPGTSTASANPGLVALPGVNQEGGPAVQYMMTGRSPDRSILMPILPGLVMLATLGCMMIGRKRPRPSADSAPAPAYAYAVGVGRSPRTRP